MPGLDNPMFKLDKIKNPFERLCMLSYQEGQLTCQAGTAPCLS